MFCAHPADTPITDLRLEISRRIDSGARNDWSINYENDEPTTFVANIRHNRQFIRDTLQAFPRRVTFD